MLSQWKECHGDTHPPPLHTEWFNGRVCDKNSVCPFSGTGNQQKCTWSDLFFNNTLGFKKINSCKLVTGCNMWLLDMTLCMPDLVLCKASQMLCHEVPVHFLDTLHTAIVWPLRWISQNCGFTSMLICKKSNSNQIYKSINKCHWYFMWHMPCGDWLCFAQTEHRTGSSVSLTLRTESQWGSHSEPWFLAPFLQTLS